MIKYSQPRRWSKLSDGPLLTPVEVADILKIKKNTVYEMIKRGDLPAFRIGRKLRIPVDAIAGLQHYDRPSTINLGTIDSRPMAPSESLIVNQRDTGTLVICGQDIALDLLTRYLERQINGLRVLRNHIGSIPGLMALYEEKAHLAAIHLWDSDSDTYNIPYVRRLLPGIPAVIVHIACRQQGFYVQSGNPLIINSWRDLSRPDVSLINREPGCGTRVLLDEKLRQLGIDRSQINGYNTRAYSHLEVASSVARGLADVGVGNQKVALQVRGVEFIKLQEERYELVVREQDLSDFRIKCAISLLRSEAFKRELEGLGDYDIAEMGNIVAHT